MGAVLGVVDSVLGVVDSHNPLLPHNLTACVTSGRPPHYCRHFHLFNFSRCAASPASYATVLPTVSRCLNESGCVPLYDVPLCVERYNLSAAAFNHTECVAVVEATNPTQRPKATGCDGLLPSNETVVVDDETNATTTEDEKEEEKEQLPRFHPCAGALGRERLRRLDFLSSVPHTFYMVTELSPNKGPVTGGTSTAVCGMGFRLTNENVNHAQCRFSDGRNTVVVPAIYEDEFMLRCTAPDFSRYSVGLPHRVEVEVTLNRGAQWSSNR